MYEIALSVAACLRADTKVDVAWTVETRGFSSRDKNEALALTPGGGRIGSLLSGAVNDQLAELADRGATSKVAELHVGDIEAELAGLSCGGHARVLLVPATEFPGELWDRLREQEPVCLVTRLDGDRVTGTELYGPANIDDAGEEAARLFQKGTTDTLVTPESVTTALWPVPKVVIVGAGSIAEALTSTAGLLGWRAETTTQTSAATGAIAGLAVLDKLVVISHDVEVAGPALAAALDSRVGYIGALGSRRTQQARADWLAYRGITDLDRIHGPAGLDIGANTPAEIAVSIVAEALAVRAGKTAGSIRDRSGPVHT